MGKVIDLPKLWGTKEGFKTPREERAPVTDHALVLSRAAPMHFVRPAADVLFASAAQVFREGVVAIARTGNGVDGASAVHAVKAAGGLAIAQDESASAYFSMPRAAIRTGLVDLVLPLQHIGSALTGWDLTGAHP